MMKCKKVQIHLNFAQSEDCLDQEEKEPQVARLFKVQLSINLG